MTEKCCQTQNIYGTLAKKSKSHQMSYSTAFPTEYMGHVRQFVYLFMNLIMITTPQLN